MSAVQANVLILSSVVSISRNTTNLTKAFVTYVRLYWSTLLLFGHPPTFISSIIMNLSKNLSLNVCHFVNLSRMLNA